MYLVLSHLWLRSTLHDLNMLFYIIYVTPKSQAHNEDTISLSYEAFVISCRTPDSLSKGMPHVFDSDLNLVNLQAIVIHEHNPETIMVSKAVLFF